MSATKAKLRKRRPVPQDPPVKWSHEWWASTQSDVALRRIVDFYKVKNLRNYADEETRWCALRLSAARRELKLRKEVAP